MQILRGLTAMKAVNVGEYRIIPAEDAVKMLDDVYLKDVPAAWSNVFKTPFKRVQWALWIQLKGLAHQSEAEPVLKAIDDEAKQQGLDFLEARGSYKAFTVSGKGDVTHEALVPVAKMPEDVPEEPGDAGGEEPVEAPPPLDDGGFEKPSRGDIPGGPAEPPDPPPGPETPRTPEPEEPEEPGTPETPGTPEPEKPGTPDPAPVRPSPGGRYIAYRYVDYKRKRTPPDSFMQRQIDKIVDALRGFDLDVGCGCSGTLCSERGPEGRKLAAGFARWIGCRTMPGPNEKKAGRLNDVVFLLLVYDQEKAVSRVQASDCVRKALRIFRRAGIRIEKAHAFFHQTSKAGIGRWLAGHGGGAPGGRGWLVKLPFSIGRTRRAGR